MTFKEKLAMEHPEAISDKEFAGCKDCPHAYGYDDGANALCMSKGVCDNEKINEETCTKCWNREMPGTENEERILELKTGPINDESAKLQEAIYKESGLPSEIINKEVYPTLATSTRQSVITLNI